jgi:hypothetical protein
MNFSTLVDRVRFEFMEMPDLELTMAQAVRLWNLGADDCRYVIDALVDSGFLRWTPQRTIVRSGRSFSGLTRELDPTHVSVLAGIKRNNFV